MGHLVSTALAATLFGSSPAPLPASPASPVSSASPGHYIFAWAGDPEGKAEDFIVVIHGDPASPDYGHLVATGTSGVKTQQMHHTEYWMPEGGLLFANDHAAGRTVVMDLRDPLHGGIVEIDDQGKMIRSASTADPTRPNDLLMAYSLLPLPDIDRVLVTNSSMRDEDKTVTPIRSFGCPI